MDTQLVRTIARELRYRSLDHLIGHSVEIRDLDHIEEAVRPARPPECHLQPHDHVGAVAKYGILNLTFTAPRAMLAGVIPGGIPLLRELGYLPGGIAGSQNRACDDPICLEMLHDEIALGQTWLLLYLEGGPPDHLGIRVPDGYFPRSFHILDACVTNASGVWLWKHFYL